MNCALYYIIQSKRNGAIGAIKVARKQGIIAAYLNVAAIVSALVVAALVLAFVLVFVGPAYARRLRCISDGRSDLNSSYCTKNSIIIKLLFH